MITIFNGVIGVVILITPPILLALVWYWIFERIQREWFWGSQEYETRWGRLGTGLSVPVIQLVLGVMFFAYLCKWADEAEELMIIFVLPFIFTHALAVAMTTFCGFRRVLKAEKEI